MICDGCGGDNAYWTSDLEDEMVIRCPDCGHAEREDD